LCPRGVACGGQVGGGARVRWEGGGGVVCWGRRGGLNGRVSIRVAMGMDWWGGGGGRGGVDVCGYGGGERWGGGGRGGCGRQVRVCLGWAGGGWGGGGGGTALEVDAAGTRSAIRGGLWGVAVRGAGIGRGEPFGVAGWVWRGVWSCARDGVGVGEGGGGGGEGGWCGWCVAGGVAGAGERRGGVGRAAGGRTKGRGGLFVDADACVGGHDANGRRVWSVWGVGGWRSQLSVRGMGGVGPGGLRPAGGRERWVRRDGGRGVVDSWGLVGVGS